jgi:HD domain.
LVSEIFSELQQYHKSKIFGSPSEKEVFVYTPADTRFPGNTNSLGEHLITTSAFAVVALLSYLEKYGKVLINEPEYQNIQDKLQDREFLRGLVRLAALLHDIGKPPPQGHVERSCDFIKSLKQELGDDVTQALSSIVARHHYGIDYQNKPRNVLEWIVAFADKASAGSRGFIPKDEPDKFKRIIEFFMNLNPGYDLGKQRLNLIQQVLSGTETFEEQDDVEKFLLGFLSKNPERVYMINKALIEAEKKILESGDFTADKETRLLALLHLDVPSIQSYITRGRSLAVSVGYSLMIDAFIHKIAKIIEEEIGKEVILSKEGGSLLALVPVGYSDKLAKKIKVKSVKLTI